MKNIMLLGLLAVMGLSLAFTPPTGPEWGNYVKTCCVGNQVYDFGQDVYKTYYVWNGDSCVYPDVVYYMEIEWMMFGFDGEPNVDEYFDDMIDACNAFGQTSPECISAKSQFNSFAKSTRTFFSTAYMGYMLAARQAIQSYYNNGCGTSPGQVSSDLRDAAYSYRECIQEQCGGDD